MVLIEAILLVLIAVLLRETYWKGCGRFENYVPKVIPSCRFLNGDQ